MPEESFKGTPPGKIMIIGDSITDCGRNRQDSDDLGRGYACLAAEGLQARYPQHPIKIWNRGISGDRLDTLLDRWEADCLDHHPDLISLLVGVNHTVHTFKRDNPTSTEAFEENYRMLLEITRDRTSARLLIMEPFLLPVVTEAEVPFYYPTVDVYEKWREDLNPKIQVVRKLAAEYGAHLIRLDEIFSQVASDGNYGDWLPDGVHPTDKGHELIVNHWLKAVTSEIEA